MCAVSVHLGLLQRSRRLRAKNLLGHLTYPASKDKGESSMSGKRGNVKAGSVVVPASPARKAKPVLAEL